MNESAKKSDKRAADKGRASKQQVQINFFEKHFFCFLVSKEL
jgi:hypothetical protein